MSFDSDRFSSMKRAKFVCQICNELFDDSEDFDDHLRTRHPENYNRQSSALRINNIAMDLTSSLKKLREIEGEFINKIENINGIISEYARENLSLTNDYRDALKKADKLKSENEHLLRNLENEKNNHQEDIYRYQQEIQSYRVRNKDLEDRLMKLDAEKNKLITESKDLSEFVKDLNVETNTLATFIYQWYRVEIDKRMVKDLSGKPYEIFETPRFGGRSMVIYDCASYIEENFNSWIPNRILQIINSYSEIKTANSYTSRNLPLTTVKLLNQIIGNGAWIERDRIMVQLPVDFEV